MTRAEALHKVNVALRAESYSAHAPLPTLIVLEALGLISFDAPEFPLTPEQQFLAAWVKYTGDPDARLSGDQVRNLLFDNGLTIAKRPERSR